MSAYRPHTARTTAAQGPRGRAVVRAPLQVVAAEPTRREARKKKHQRIRAKVRHWTT